MKTILKKIALLTIAFATFNAVAQTPFYFSMPINGGLYQTNPVTFQAWPPTANGFVVIGTNIVYGANIVTNTPNATGFFSNSLYPNSYRVFMPDLNAAFFVTIPNTTAYASLSVYITNAPVSTPFAGYAVGTFSGITNSLGYWPATNNSLFVTNIWVSSITTYSNGVGAATNVTANFSTNILRFQQ